MNEKNFVIWESTREKGKIRFFLLHGVLAFGLPMLVFTSFITRPFANGFTSGPALLHYEAWTFSGLFFGALMWYWAEYVYKKEKPKRNRK